MSTVNMPGLPVQTRVIVYIDGFNLYFGMRNSGLGRYLWLNLHLFAHNLLQSGQALQAVKYFTSRIKGPESKRKRQLAFLDAVGTLDPEKVSVFFGNYQENPFSCPRCEAQLQIPNEKQTDVNIAVAMLSDAFQNKFDVALLVSADSDLCPAVTTVQTLLQNKRVVACFPPGRASKELANTAYASYTIGRTKLSQSQFPDTVRTASGFELVKPSLWNDPKYSKPEQKLSNYVGGSGLR